MMDVSELFSVKDRVALVTGGSAGIGRYIATGLAAAGARVYICARSEAKLERAACEISEATGASVIPLAADISTMDGIMLLSDKLHQGDSGLHILVNNAGRLVDCPVDDHSETDWDDVMAINVKAPFFLMQKLLPLLRRDATPVRPATIINISSAGAIKIGPLENYAYQASKAGLGWITKSLAKRLGPENINVSAIAPGLFETDMIHFDTEEQRREFIKQVPSRRLGNAVDMVGATIFLASRAGAFVNGAIIPVDGGTSI